jgi:hypothetical protein
VSFTLSVEGKRIMSRRFLFLLLAAGIGTGWAAAGDPPGARKVAPNSVTEQAARLVAQLGSDDFDARETAARQLEALGPAVGPALQKAIASHDPEVRRLAVQVAERIARKMEAAEVLEPKRLRVAYRDVPLHVAVQDFMRASGARIQLEGVKDTNRKITLDTGYTTFWDAFDKFCAAAGVAEKVFDTPTNDHQNENYPWQYRRRMIMWNGRWAQQQDDIIPALTNGQFVLTEGKPAPRSSFQSGAVRFRALPAGTSLGKVSNIKGDKEIVFGLEILPEPALAWEKVQSLHIDKAIDDQGQNLRATQAFNSSETPGNEYDEVVFWGGYYDGQNQGGNNGGQRVPLRLGLGQKPSSVIKELSGVATIKMQTSTQAIATIDRVMEARDKSVKGTDGSFLKVVDIKPEEGGKLRIHVKVEQAQDENANNWNPWGWRGGMMWRGPGGGDGSEVIDSSVSTGNLVLFDARGHLIRLVAKEQIPDENGVSEEYNFVFQLAKGQPEPSKLVLQGRRPVTIDVPFTLRDVPLRALPGAPKPAPPPARPAGGPVPEIEFDR